MCGDCSADFPEIEICYTVIYVLATGLTELDDPFLCSVFLYNTQHIFLFGSPRVECVSLKVDVNNKGICA